MEKENSKLLFVVRNTDVVSQIGSFLIMSDIVSLLVATRRSNPSIVLSETVLSKLIGHTMQEIFGSQKIPISGRKERIAAAVQSFEFGKIITLRQMRDLYFFTKSIPKECIASRRRLIVAANEQQQQQATFCRRRRHGDVVSKMQITLPCNTCNHESSCPQMVLWSCSCSAVRPSEACTTHCAKCEECDEYKCDDCIAGDDICTDCGFYCEGCDVICLESDGSIECSRASCTSNLGQRCMDCAEDIAHCCKCHNAYCDACLTVAHCDVCHDTVCDECGTTGYCSICHSDICDVCDPAINFSCEICGDSTCTACGGLSACDRCGVMQCDSCEPHMVKCASCNRDRCISCWLRGKPIGCDDCQAPMCGGCYDNNCVCSACCAALGVAVPKKKA